MPAQQLITKADQRDIPFLLGTLCDQKVTWKQAHEWVISSWILTKLRDTAEGSEPFVGAFEDYSNDYIDKATTKALLVSFIDIDRDIFRARQYDASIYQGLDKKDGLQKCMDTLNSDVLVGARWRERLLQHISPKDREGQVRCKRRVLELGKFYDCFACCQLFKF